MRKLKELTAEDFPGVDKSLFENWKKARIDANKKIIIAIIIIIVLLPIINIILITNKVYGDDPNNGLIVYCFILLIYCIVILSIGYKPIKLQKGLGLTNKSIRNARKNNGYTTFGSYVEPISDSSTQNVEITTQKNQSIEEYIENNDALKRYLNYSKESKKENNQAAGAKPLRAKGSFKWEKVVVTSIIITIFAFLIIAGNIVNNQDGLDVRWYNYDGVQTINGETVWKFALYKPKNGEPTANELKQMLLKMYPTILSAMPLNKQINVSQNTELEKFRTFLYFERTDTKDLAINLAVIEVIPTRHNTGIYVAIASMILGLLIAIYFWRRGK